MVPPNATLAARVVEEGLTRDEVAEEVKAKKPAPSRKPAAKGRGAAARKPKKVTAEVIRLAGGTKVTVENRRGLDPEAIALALEEALAKVRGDMKVQEGRVEEAA
jgi:hypothetical protein